MRTHWNMRTHGTLSFDGTIEIYNSYIIDNQPTLVGLHLGLTFPRFDRILLLVLQRFRRASKGLISFLV